MTICDRCGKPFHLVSTEIVEDEGLWLNNTYECETGPVDCTTVSEWWDL
ncbi:unnamed protein product [marine sediment metagenome]|uniref:Uncharacterized protein n=1 Tax=marine sediment metagenome TaxID=412755 RepID=X1AST7_9ZZZZ